MIKVLQLPDTLEVRKALIELEALGVIRPGWEKFLVHEEPDGED